MKKTVMLFTFTSICMLTIAITGNIWRNSLPQVTAVKVNAITARSSIVCTGKVERASVSNLYAPAASVIKEVFVRPGERIEKGKPLFSVTAPLGEVSGNTDPVQEVYAALLQRNDSSLPTPVGNRQQETSKTVNAPIDGEVTAVSAMANMVADPAKPAVTIAGMDGLQIRLAVNEAQISDLTVGQPVEITGIGFKGSRYFGEVKSISSEARQAVSASGQETVVDVLVLVKNPGQDIKPGFTAKARIITKSRENLIIVPYEAVQAEEDGTEFVYRLIGSRAEKTYVVTGEEYEDGFEIKEGLSIKDVIILEPGSLADHKLVVPSHPQGEDVHHA